MCAQAHALVTVENYSFSVSLAKVVGSKSWKTPSGSETAPVAGCSAPRFPRGLEDIVAPNKRSVFTTAAGDASTLDPRESRGSVVNASRGNITMSIPPRYYVTPGPVVSLSSGSNPRVECQRVARSKRRDWYASRPRGKETLRGPITGCRVMSLTYVDMVASLRAWVIRFKTREASFLLAERQRSPRYFQRLESRGPGFVSVSVEGDDLRGKARIMEEQRIGTLNLTTLSSWDVRKKRSNILSCLYNMMGWNLSIAPCLFLRRGVHYRKKKNGAFYVCDNRHFRLAD